MSSKSLEDTAVHLEMAMLTPWFKPKYPGDEAKVDILDKNMVLTWPFRDKLDCPVLQILR